MSGSSERYAQGTHPRLIADVAVRGIGGQRTLDFSTQELERMKRHHGGASASESPR